MVGVAAGIAFAAALASHFSLITGGVAVATMLLPLAALPLVARLAPALGLIANHASLNATFLVSTLVVLSAALIAAQLLRAPVTQARIRGVRQ